MATVNQLSKERPLFFLIVMSAQRHVVYYTYQDNDIPIDIGEYCRAMKYLITTARGGVKIYKLLATVSTDIRKINPDAIYRSVYVDDYNRYLGVSSENVVN